MSDPRNWRDDLIDERYRERHKNDPQKTLVEHVGNLFGAVLGWVILGSIALGIVGAVLSPSSCSGGDSTEYRHR